MYEHIVSDAGVLGGKPHIKGTRISIKFLLELVASGACRQDTLAAYPHLATEDVEKALRYAAQSQSSQLDRWTGIDGSK